MPIRRHCGPSRRAPSAIEMRFHNGISRGRLYVSATWRSASGGIAERNRALMRKRIFDPIWCGFCAVVISTLLVAPEAKAGTVTVHVGPAGKMTFEPDFVSIAVGDTVQWIWDTDFHSVTGANKDFDSGVNGPPFTFSHTFMARAMLTISASSTVE